MASIALGIIRRVYINILYVLVEETRETYYLQVEYNNEKQFFFLQMGFVENNLWNSKYDDLTFKIRVLIFANYWCRFSIRSSKAGGSSSWPGFDRKLFEHRRSLPHVYVYVAKVISQNAWCKYVTNNNNNYIYFNNTRGVVTVVEALEQTVFCETSRENFQLKVFGRNECYQNITMTITVVNLHVHNTCFVQDVRWNVEQVLVYTCIKRSEVKFSERSTEINNIPPSIHN